MCEIEKNKNKYNNIVTSCPDFASSSINGCANSICDFDGVWKIDRILAPFTPFPLLLLVIDTNNKIITKNMLGNILTRQRNI